MPSGVYIRTEQNLRNQKESMKRPDVRKKLSESLKKYYSDPEVKRKHKEIHQNIAKRPEFRRKLIERNKKMSLDPEWRLKNKESAKKRSKNPIWRDNVKNGLKKLFSNPEYRQKHKEDMQRITKTQKWKNSHKKSIQSYNWKLKQMECVIGGFWYGNVSYTDDDLITSIRHSVEYNNWRNSVFKRDGYRDFLTEECDSGNLRAHHLKPFIKILEENNIQTFSQALKCEELWDIDNGITLLDSNHKELHNKYGYGNYDQITLFLIDLFPYVKRELSILS